MHNLLCIVLVSFATAFYHDNHDSHDHAHDDHDDCDDFDDHDDQEDHENDENDDFDESRSDQRIAESDRSCPEVNHATCTRTN